MKNLKPMAPYGMALQAYFQGDETAEVISRREDGLEGPMAIRDFFRTPGELPFLARIEKVALDKCYGHVLDMGAGTGVHSLALQQRGLPVTAIDISPQAVSIMRQRGVKDALCADIFTYQGGPYDTLLMMCHGIGLVETIAGLERFLAHAHSLLAEDGQLLFDSMDVRKTDEPIHLAYLQAIAASGRYIGEVRMQLVYKNVCGPLFGFLHVDPETLAESAAAHGRDCKVLLSEDNGDYLAGLTREIRHSEHSEESPQPSLSQNDSGR